LAGDDHADGFLAVVERLMPLGWKNFDSFASMHDKMMVLNFQGQFTFQKKELPGIDVRMPYLTGAGSIRNKE
jgi:hypothetical protein